MSPCTCDLYFRCLGGLISGERYGTYYVSGILDMMYIPLDILMMPWDSRFVKGCAAYPLLTMGPQEGGDAPFSREPTRPAIFARGIDS